MEYETSDAIPSVVAPAPVLAPAADLGEFVQTKMTVGSTSDPQEAAADRVAELVVRSARSPVTASPATGGRVHRSPARNAPPVAAATATARRVQRSALAAHSPGRIAGRRVQRAVPLVVQRVAPIGRRGGDLDPETERSLRAAQRGGQALDADVQRRIGDVTGADLSNVRLHSGAQSRDLNEQLGAEAFTVGRDVFFRDGIPDTNTDAGLGLVAHEAAHTVQQGASKVSRRLLDQDESESGGDGGMEAGPDDPSGAEEAAEPEESGPEATPELSGSIPDVTESIGPESIEGVGQWEEDASRPGARSGAGPRRSAKRQASRSTFELDSEIGTSTSVRQAGDAASTDDDDRLVAGKLVTTGEIVGPTPKPAFGAMGTKITLGGITWVLAKGKIKIDMTIQGRFEWGTSGGGRTDVASSTSPHITADNYEQVATDLYPVLKGKCWRSPRTNFWSEAITARHEVYHANDADKWVKKKGRGVARAYLKKNPIELTDTQREDAGVVKTKVMDVLKGVQAELTEGRRYYFRKNITDYLMYPGEIRAFGDGKKPYIKLAKGVRAHGKKLAKAAAKAAKSTPTSTPTPEPVGATGTGG